MNQAVARKGPREALGQLTEEELDGLVHDLKSQEATTLNNAGREAQIDYILGCALHAVCERPRTKYVCINQETEACAETRPTRGASAYWDVSTQQWELTSDMEDMCCPECNGDLEEVPA